MTSKDREFAFWQGARDYRDGILLCDYDCAVQLAAVLREYSAFDSSLSRNTVFPYVAGSSTPEKVRQLVLRTASRLFLTLDSSWRRCGRTTSRLRKGPSTA